MSNSTPTRRNRRRRTMRTPDRPRWHMLLEQRGREKCLRSPWSLRTFEATPAHFDKEELVPNVQAVLAQEIRRLARREIRAELEATKKTVSRHHHEVADLKRRNADLERRITYLESRETARLKAGPAKAKPPKGTRFSVRSLKSQRGRAGLSQAEYATLVGVSVSTISNWESGTTKPGKKHMAKLISLRGLGKREARRRLELLSGD